MIRRWLERRRADRRLLDADVRNLTAWYGHRAEARALAYEAAGVSTLTDGRRLGHWRRVAQQIADLPKEGSAGAVFG